MYFEISNKFLDLEKKKIQENAKTKVLYVSQFISQMQANKR